MAEFFKIFNFGSGKINLSVDNIPEAKTINPGNWDEGDESDTASTKILLFDNWNDGEIKGIREILFAGVHVASIIFNIILLMLFCIFETVRATPSHHFIAALASANILFSTHLVIFNILWDPPDESLCDYAVYGGLIYCSFSNLSRCAIGVDRYIFISDPLRYYQRTQSKARPILFAVAFLFMMVLIVAPYMFFMANISNIVVDQIACLPPRPDIYITVMTSIIFGIPAMLLTVIYTQIFYWAFLQMQILRQEAKINLQTANKDCYGESDQTRKSKSAVSSEKLRAYTSASIILTPTLPFESDKAASYKEESSITRATPSFVRISSTVHKLIHMVSGMSEQSFHSTCVDTAALHLRDNTIINSESNALAKSDESYNQIRPSNFSQNNTKTSLGSQSPNTDSTLSHNLAIVLPQSFERSRFASEKLTKGYKPVTEQGKWMAQRLKNYEIKVERMSISQMEETNQDLMCKLLKAEIKAAAMIMALMGSFIVCWLPFFIIQIIDVLNTDKITTAERRISIMMVVFNCMVDPFTYALMNPPFRAVVVRSCKVLHRELFHRHTIHDEKPAHSRKLAYKYALTRRSNDAHRS